ncbi:MAG TPA: hypothetical protein VLZ12_11810 [Verrucomicrobiae bacterium]|nr:hypothetical protein [Verrucomicrobiae bacterium]
MSKSNDVNLAVKPLLNEAQRRTISITLAGIERDLLQLKQALNGTPADGVLARHSEPLAQGLKQAATDLIAGIQHKIQSLAHTLELSPQHEPQLRTLLATLVLAGVAVEEIKPRHLRGYGNVDPATREFLNAELPPLQSLLRQLTELLDANGFVNSGHGTHERLPPKQ